MAKITLYTYNILARETSAITVTGSPDSGYPESRLYDHSIHFYWKYTNTGDVTIECDQGASGNLSVDFLAIERHNFNGRTIYWEYSDNGSSWSDAVTSWSQGSNNQIIQTLDDAITHRYWRVRVIGAVNPQAAEIFMSGGKTFQVRFDEMPSGSEIDNVMWIETLGGLERSTKLGDERRTRTYSFIHTSSELTNFRTAMGYLNGYSKPFYVKDHEDDYWLARFSRISTETYQTEGTTLRQIGIQEML